MIHGLKLILFYEIIFIVFTISNCYFLSPNKNRRCKRLNLTPSSLPDEKIAVIFEPQIDNLAIISFFATSSILVVAGGYWWTVLVPQQRTKLAISKNKGEVKAYLDELRNETIPDKGFERWLFSDWLNKSSSPKPGALPFLKKAKWNSGDNPIIIAFSGIMAFVLVASVFERF